MIENSYKALLRNRHATITNLSLPKWLVGIISPIVSSCSRGSYKFSKTFQTDFDNDKSYDRFWSFTSISQLSREDRNLMNDQDTIRVWDESRSDFIEFKLDKIGCRKMVTFRKGNRMQLNQLLEITFIIS